MKTLTKTTLAAAIAVASFGANAELKAMDDAVLSGVTGQAGVTIDIKLQPEANKDVVSVGEVKYTDEGSVSIKNIKVNTADGDALTISQTIDVNSDGELVTGMSILDNKMLKVEVGSVDLESAAGTTTANVASDVVLNVGLGQTDTIIGKKGSGSFVAANVPASAGEDGKTLIKSTTSIEIKDSSLNAVDGNIKIGGLSFNQGGVGNKASVTQYIWANDNGVNIQMSSIQGDLTVGSLSFGTKPSIGSVSVSNIEMAGLTQTIYGH